MTNTQLFLIGALTLAIGSTPAGQTPAPAPATMTTAQDDPRLEKLPPALREQGRQILAAADEDTRADLAEALADEHAIDALDFLLTLLDTDPSATSARTSSTSWRASTIRAWIPRSSVACSSIPISTSRWPRSSCCGRAPKLR